MSDYIDELEKYPGDSTAQGDGEQVTQEQDVPRNHFLVLAFLFFLLEQFIKSVIYVCHWINN